MPERIPCSACGRGVRVSASDAGRPVVCLACGATFLAPPWLASGSPAAGAAAPIAPVPRVETSPPDLSEAPAPRAGGTPVPQHAPRAGRAAAVLGACAAAVVLVALVAGAVLSSRRGAGPAGPQAAPPAYRDLAELLKQEDAAKRLALAGRFDESRARYDALLGALGGADPSDAAARDLADRARADRETVRREIERRQRAPAFAAVQTPQPATPPSPAPPTRPAPVARDAAEPRARAVPPTSTPGPSPAPAAAAAVAPPRRPPIQPQPELAVGVSDAEIGESIQRGADWLVQQFDPQKFQIRSESGERRDPAYYCGLNALCAYALMQGGQTLHDPRLDARGPFVKGLIDRMKRMSAGPGHPEVYARGLRATALALFARPEDRTALQTDLRYLLDGHAAGAYTYQAVRNARYTSAAAMRDGPWDNSNSQYGLLGVWSAAEAGEEVPMAYWKVVEDHWVETQSDNGQWGYREPRQGGTLSMTAAGTASLFVAEEYLDRARLGAKVGREPFSPSLAKALKWWETEDNAVSIYGNWWGYTLYGIERVGLASGFKYFGAHDWYRELAGQAVRRQRADGSWAGTDGDGPDPVETAYALLFLARGRHPIVMNKVRFDGFWANRPRDAGNLARFAGRQLERPLNWQVVSLDRPYADWLDSPVLYLASHRPFDLKDRDLDNLRGYVEAGGLLFTHCDGDSPAAFDSFIAALARRLFPQYEVADLPPSHPIYNVVYKVNAAAAPLKAVSNGSRVLMVHSPTDLAKTWQLRDEQKGKPIFQLGVNLFIYAAGKRELRNRLSSPYVSDPGPPATGQTIDVARLQYPGNWDPEPGAWRRYARWFQRQTGTAVSLKTVAWKSLRPDTAPVAHLTGTAAYNPSDEELNALRAYVQSGGVLLVDSTGGSADFANAIDSALAKAFPTEHLNPIKPNHPLLHPAASGMTDVSTFKLRPYAAETLGRAASPASFQSLTSGGGTVIQSPLDLTTGLLGTKTWAILGFDDAWSQDFLKNVLLWTLDGHSVGNKASLGGGSQSND